MILFSHWLFWLKNWRFSTNSSQGFIVSLKDRAFVINIDEYSDIGTYWIALYALNNNVTYFDVFGVEHIPKEIKAFIRNKNTKGTIFRVKAYDSIICGYFCIWFIDFMLAEKTLSDLPCFLHQINLKKWWCNFKLFHD